MPDSSIGDLARGFAYVVVTLCLAILVTAAVADRDVDAIVVPAVGFVGVIVAILARR